MNFIIIGEAASCIVAGSRQFVRDHADIPWQQMRGIRNRMAHGCFDIDLQIVWVTIEREIPRLLVPIQDLKKLL